jgi:hypothetical protein
VIIYLIGPYFKIQIMIVYNQGGSRGRERKIEGRILDPDFVVMSHNRD